MATASDGGKESAAAASPPPQLESFLSIGLDQRTAENALANRKVTANLTAVITEVLASRHPPQSAPSALIRFDSMRERNLS
jgi:glutaminyl-tRNA synthetase